MIETIQAAIMYFCLGCMMVGAAVIVFARFGGALVAAFRRLGGKRTLVMALFAVAAIIYGGSKSVVGRVTVSDPYVVVAGSFVTNDYIHVAIAKRTELIPDSTEILVYYRQLDSTNAEDWVEFTPRLTIADFPHDFLLPDATNYNALVAANYVPAPTVHTNGVWLIKGFVIPDNGRFAFPNTRIRKEQSDE